MCNGTLNDYCIEAVADGDDKVMITATRIPDQPTVLATRGEWETFLKEVKNGDFDHLFPETCEAKAAAEPEPALL